MKSNMKKIAVVGTGVIGNGWIARFLAKGFDVVAFDLAEDMIGREVLVMIEGKVADENVYVGRTYKDAPNVDGLIFVNTDEELMSGDLARVKVTGAAEYDLIGELM